MIDTIMKHRLLVERPPVLIDVGASGEIHQDWKAIAKYSICIGFDGDVRETDFSADETQGYRKLYLFNKIVSDSNAPTNFYLTNSPFCSSRLEPDAKSLSSWAFEGAFDVVQVIQAESATLSDVLSKLNLDYVDWFKADSQGTDLRIFISLGKSIVKDISVAEFEPGIIDSYKGEDKLHHVLKYMESLPFWMSSMVVKGTQRITRNNLNKYFPDYVNRLHDFNFLQEASACWAEVRYINKYQNDSCDERNFLFGCAVALSMKQYGFCIDLAETALQHYSDPIFGQVLEYAVNKIKKKEKYVFPKKLFGKFMRMISQ